MDSAGHPLRARTDGLTLIEVMMVVVVIGVLVSAAVPEYRTYVYQSQRTEAITGLRATHDLQVEYYGKHNEYADSYLELGAPLRAGTMLSDGSFQGQRYTFSLEAWDLGPARNGNYRATATANLDGADATLDILIIENQLKVYD